MSRMSETEVRDRFAAAGEQLPGPDDRLDEARRRGRRRVVIERSAVAAVVLAVLAGGGALVAGALERDPVPVLDGSVPRDPATPDGQEPSPSDAELMSAVWPEIGSAAVQAAAAGDLPEWRGQPMAVVARFLTQEIGWDPPAMTAGRQQGGIAEVVVQSDGYTVTFRLIRPEGASSWWITHAADRDGLALSVSRRDGRLELHADGPPGTVLNGSYRWDGGGIEMGTTEDHHLRGGSVVPHDTDGVLLLVARDASGEVVDLLLTLIPGGDFAAG